MSHITFALEVDATKSLESQVLVHFDTNNEPIVIPSKRKIIEVWLFEQTQSVDSPVLLKRMFNALLCLLNYLPSAELCKRLRKNLPLSNNQFMRLAYLLTNQPAFNFQDDNFNFIRIPILPGGFSLTCSYNMFTQFKIKSIENIFIPVPISVDENYFSQLNGQSYAQWARSNNLVGVSPIPSLFRNPSSLSSRESRNCSLSKIICTGDETELANFRDLCDHLLQENIELISFTSVWISQQDLKEMNDLLEVFQEQFSSL